MWKLVIEDDEGKRTVVPLTRDDYTIGRQEGNTIRLTERNVSREHGRIKRKRNGAAAPAPPTNGSAKDNFVLEDRSSYNGLFVNGLRVAHTQDLQHGDLIQIGDYRIVLQDDAASSIETAAIPVTTTDPGHDAKATIPMAAAFRGQDLTDRPSRFVMLVGPTPGVEYPLERERMTIGRAEDSSISVNHNSVSRLHCEVHALGDGRYEIVDKGSSNGVRVNAVELKRSIIEAGDVIELGDVRFKFVGAGQVFVPGPNESQQLTAISDREAELADPRRKSWGGYALPIVGAGLVGALIILAFVWVLRARAADNGPGNITTTPDTEQALIIEAKKTCTPDDCDAAYQQISSLPDKSPWRSHKDFRDIENMWADSMFKKAAAATDVTVKRAMLAKVGAAATLDESHRAKLAAALADLDQPAATPSQLPVASVTPPVTSTPLAVATPPVVPPSAARPPVTTHATTTTTGTAVTPPTTTTTPTVKPPSGPSALDKANEAALEGRYADVRRLLEQKVRAGHGNSEEVRLVRKACSSPFDKACVDDIKAKYP
ncbi:MAG: Adenylate cyclase, partial [Myxococcaceae bacterium]|nr:Adenylate cyclase [Myxococcaceae bacterium]